MIHQLHERADHVADVTETTALFSIAVNRDRTAGECLLHERRNHHAVLSGLSRPDRVEETHDNRRQLLLAPVSQREKLIDRFRARVAPAPFRRRAHHEVAVFTKRHVGAETIDLGSRCDQHLLLFLVRKREDDFGAAHVCFDCAHRTLDDQLHSDCRREMEDDVTLIDKLGGNRVVVDCVDRVMKTRVTFKVLNILERAGGKIVDYVNFVATLDVSVAEMRSDETRATCDKYSQTSTPLTATKRPTKSQTSCREHLWLLCLVVA